MYICKMETLAGLRYTQLMMVTACRQGKRGSMSDSDCKESSLPACAYTFGCLLAGQTVFYSRPRRRLLFAAVFRLPVGSTQTFSSVHRGLCPVRYSCWCLSVTIHSYKKRAAVLHTHVSLDVVLKHGVNFPSLYIVCFVRISKLDGT